MTGSPGRRARAPRARIPAPSARASLAPAGASARPRRGRRFFLPIGVPAPGGMLRDLPGVPADVARMGAAFVRLDYEVMDAAPNPSARELRDALFDRVESTMIGPADALVVYFSGHGLVVAGDHYLCPRGFDRDDAARTGIKTRELVELIVRSRWRPGRLWLILDCCQAGGVLEDGLLAAVAAAGTDAFVLAASGSWGPAQDGRFSRAFCSAVGRATRGARASCDALGAIMQAINRRRSGDPRAIQATVCRSRFDLLDAVR